MRLLFLSPLLLAGCHSPTPGDAPAAPATPAANGAGARVAALSAPLRAGVMLRAIRDAGQPCQQVTVTTAVNGARPPTWIATCDNGRRWLVGITDDGTASVTDAAAATGHAS